MTPSNQQLRFRQRNRAYYDDLERLHRLLVPTGQRVLDIGCGMGDLLAGLNPGHGVGIELEPELAKAAQRRHPQLRILAADAETISPSSIGESEPFDVILLPNTLNTLGDVQGVLERLEAFCHPRTRLVVSFHNWLWQPLLKAAEQLGQRQPQPPESWLTPRDVANLLDLAGWEVLKEGHRCLLPRRLPLLTPLANRWLSQLPGLEQLGLTHWMVARPGRQERQDPSVSVVIPARNEAGNIAPAIERLPELGRFTEVLFVEGHSTDDTWAEIERVCANYQGPLRLRKFRQSGKGKADAVWLGFEQAEGDVLMILDADLTVRPEDLPRFAQAMADGRGEFVNGCRLVYPRSWDAMPPLNTAANRLFAAVFSWLLRQRLKDTLCGTKVIWKHDYERLKAGRSYFGDFDPFGDFDLLFGASKLNLKIVEVPVRYQERSYGSSNIAHVKEGLILARMCLYAARKLRFIP
ncbi:glycosyltransferase [Synechococcus sp. HJ21-Hayes]|jgi:SAM-dependent methyltransferase|uniref:glycosyltransferase n=1 Tax=unclassified Synechococcus TaxID=2626047 RepID=UPI0020CDCF87|nr:MULTISPECIES: glycosyltransferase [unclassified Synechococcus]MCP9832401.1 glycosyltransferase [Synechococcus sp. JJ3a-Johnson]MCP9853944.1 glycosyltransferase [Synechococcus sp. HJ21-Hayes]